MNHQEQALAYLQRQFGADAPATVALVGRFEEQKLEREGPMSVFAFQASLGGNPREQYYVVSGQTEPNYYPACDLTPEEAYSLHLGTRFMLVMAIGQYPLEELPGSMGEDLKRQLARVAPGESVSDVRPVAAFRFEEDRHAVCRMRIGNEDVYVMGGDLPLGIYRQTHLPPHTVYRMHLGNIIRHEISDEG